MIYYPLSLLMLAGSREVLISTPDDQASLQPLLGDGSRFGIHFRYTSRPRYEGLTQAFLTGERFIGDNKVCLVLGDNVFYGLCFTLKLKQAVIRNNETTILGYQVKDPESFGVTVFNAEKRAIILEEKFFPPFKLRC